MSNQSPPNNQSGVPTNGNGDGNTPSNTANHPLPSTNNTNQTSAAAARAQQSTINNNNSSNTNPTLAVQPTRVLNTNATPPTTAAAATAATHNNNNDNTPQRTNTSAARSGRVDNSNINLTGVEGLDLAATLAANQSLGVPALPPLPHALVPTTTGTDLPGAGVWMCCNIQYAPTRKRCGKCQSWSWIARTFNKKEKE